MEGDEYFVALTLEDARDDHELWIFPAEVLVEAADDVSTRANLIGEVKTSVEAGLHRMFVVKSAFVTRCMPFAEPTLCEVEMTCRGVRGTNSERDTRKLTRIVEQFIISDRFTLGDAFFELRTRADNRDLGNPIAYNFSPVQF